MATFVNIHIEKKHDKQLRHDTRVDQVDNVKNDNNNIYFDHNFNRVEFNHLNQDLKFEYFEKVKQDLIDFKNEIRVDNANHIKNYNENKKPEEKRKRSSFQAHTVLMNSTLLSFSTHMQKDYYENQDLFLKKLKELMADFEKTYNTKITNSSIHLDETTPHVHFDFLNYDFKNHTTLKRNLTKQNLRKMQDLAGKYFEDFGVGYKRGIPVEITNAKHLNTKQMRSAEKFQKDITKKLDSTDVDLNQLLKLRKDKRIETKKLLNREDINNNKIILTELTKKINNERKIIKELKKIITKTIDKNTGFFKPNINEIVKDIHKVLKTNDSIKLLNDISQITTGLKTDDKKITEKELEIKELNKIIKEKNKELNYKNDEINSIKKTHKNEIDSLKNEIDRSKKNEKNNDDLKQQVKSLLSDNSRQRARISELTKSKSINKNNNIDL